MPDGAPVSLFTLTNTHGMTAKIIDFGAIITELHVAGRDGTTADVVLGFDTLAPNLADNPFFGALVGRYGNRIAGGRFELDGTSHQLDINAGAHHLHGGARGFYKVKWTAQPDADGLTLHYRSVDGEQGYPGNLDVTVRYELTDDNELVMLCSAVTDRATPVNLTQHSYFNLAGAGDILAHELMIRADTFTPVDAGLIPTGALAPVAGTPFDFRSARPIGERIGVPDQQLRNGAGYDHNFVLDKLPSRMGLAARVREPHSGRVLELYTEEPGVQFYSGNFLDGSLAGKGRSNAYRSGFCLEPQHFPDSPNQPTFPTTILRPGERYMTESRFRFSVEK
ncbi:MAG: galactose mutarotase [Pseudomonadota bacterium]|nr:galactose mutarotase [Pseudomonadota bacterium]